jgi:hypothetical protein
MMAISCKEIGHNFQSDGAICVRCGKAMCELIAKEPPRPSTEILCRDAKAHVWLQGRCLVCGLSQAVTGMFTPPPPTPPPPTMPHAHALYEEAERTISGPRRGDYGDAAESFRRIALTWSAVLGVKVTPQQVALCMVGLKICREANAHKHDSLVDICGYTGLIAEMEAAPK